MSVIRVVGGSRDTPMSVGQDGRARVLAQCHTVAFNHAISKRCWRVLASVVLSGSTPEPVFFMKSLEKGLENGSQRVLCIDRIIFSSDAVINWELHFGNIRTSGGAERTPTNLFAGSPEQPDGDFFDGSTPLVLDETSNEEIECLFTPGGATFEQILDGRIILPANTTFSIHAIGAISDKIRVAVDFFVESVESGE